MVLLVAIGVGHGQAVERLGVIHVAQFGQLFALTPELAIFAGVAFLLVVEPVGHGAVGKLVVGELADVVLGVGEEEVLVVVGRGGLVGGDGGRLGGLALLVAADADGRLDGYASLVVFGLIGLRALRREDDAVVDGALVAAGQESERELIEQLDVLFVDACVVVEHGAHHYAVADGAAVGAHKQANVHAVGVFFVFLAGAFAFTFTFGAFGVFGGEVLDQFVDRLAIQIDGARVEADAVDLCVGAHVAKEPEVGTAVGGVGLEVIVADDVAVALESAVEGVLAGADEAVLGGGGGGVADGIVERGAVVDVAVEDDGGRLHHFGQFVIELRNGGHVGRVGNVDHHIGQRLLVVGGQVEHQIAQQRVVGDAFSDVGLPCVGHHKIFLQLSVGCYGGELILLSGGECDEIKIVCSIISYPTEMFFIFNGSITIFVLHCHCRSYAVASCDSTRILAHNVADVAGRAAQITIPIVATIRVEGVEAVYYFSRIST